MKTLIGFDFSIAKPAACVYKNNEYYFYSWVKNLSNKLIDIYSSNNVNIRRREHKEIKDLVQSELVNSNILSKMIIEDLEPYLKDDPYIIFEGASFGSKGNQLISLTAWRYIFMQNLNTYIPFDNMYTFAPISIKKTAGCSKKGMGKKEMIDSFLASNHEVGFRTIINKNPIIFKKRTGNWIDHLDDFIDSFWAIETFKERIYHS